MKQYFTRGKFAKLNDVSLFTLRLYERIGILKSAYTDENGYHYYSNDQSQQLLFISLCVKAGLSLQEIRTLQNEVSSPAQMLELLETVRERIHQKRVEYNSCEHMVESLIYYHEAWQKEGFGRFFVKEGIHYHGFVSRHANFLLPEHAEYCHEFIRDTEARIGHPIEFPLSYLIHPSCPELSAMRAILRTKEFFTDEDFYDSGSYGSHCIRAFRSSKEMLQQNLNALVNELQKDYEPLGPILLTPVQNYLFRNQDDEATFVIGVPIRG